MVTTAKLMRHVARMRLMAFFPGRDAELVAALATELNALCDDDSEADQLVAEFMSDNTEGWPGIGVLQGLYGRQKREREDIKMMARLEAARDEHEKLCSGIVLVADEKTRTVHVEPCAADFSEDTFDGMFRDSRTCRKADRLKEGDPEVFQRIQASELAKHPGWMTLSQHVAQEYRELAKRPVQAKPGVTA